MENMQADAMDMQHCQQGHESKDMASQHPVQDQQHPDPHSFAKTCDMSGCHSVQLAAIVSNAKEFLVDVFISSSPRCNVFAASADLYPPIKPPA